MRSLDGAIYAITAQPQETADTAKQSWGLRYTLKGDSQCEIGAALRARGLPAPVVYDPTPVKESERGGEYQVGMYAPAMIALKKDGVCMFEYVVKPGPRNFGGAAPARPNGQEVLKAITAVMKEGAARVVREEALLPSMALPVMLGLMLVNGNLVEPVAFNLDGKGKQTRRFKLLPFKLLPLVIGSGLLTFYRPRAASCLTAAYASYVYFVWGAWFNRFLEVH